MNINRRGFLLGSAAGSRIARGGKGIGGSQSFAHALRHCLGAGVADLGVLRDDGGIHSQQIHFDLVGIGDAGTEENG